PAHPMKWLDQRALADTAYTGISNIDRHPVYVVTGRIPLLPGRVIDELSVPADNVRIYIDTKAFNVIRVEVDRNILDSQREDVGYQVIPGVVDVKTVETIEFSRHNGFIEIALPGVAPAVAKLSG
ncbi:MAG: hypothetical protein O2788_00005, partial [Chloroflexi bacterium]|nr:hypothetical protein [Chloroflexota bacterium]